MQGKEKTAVEKRLLLDRLFALWCKHPDLGFGQLILNCFSTDFYSMEDEKFLEVLERTSTVSRSGEE